jgi:hypothetical protein
MGQELVSNDDGSARLMARAADGPGTQGGGRDGD